MEFADFAVEIEKVLAGLVTDYSCTMTDEDDIGMQWNFTIEDAIEGFIFVEKDAPPFAIPSVTISLNLGVINDVPEEFLWHVLGMNIFLMNASLATISTPDSPNKEEQDSDENDEDKEKYDDSTGFVDFLVINTKMPYEAFKLEDLADYLNLLVVQSDFVLDALDEYNKEME